MKKQLILEITLNIETDGDFELKNEDSFFNEGFEEYTKVIVIKDVLNDNLIKDELRKLSNELHNRVFNRYDNNSAYIDIIKNIYLEHCDTDRLIHKLLGGNHLIEIIFALIDIDLLETEDEKKEYETYLKLKEKYGNVVILKEIQ